MVEEEKKSSLIGTLPWFSIALWILPAEQYNSSQGGWWEFRVISLTVQGTEENRWVKGGIEA